MSLSSKRITNALIRLRGCAGWSAPLLFANPRRQVFSRRGLSNSSVSYRHSLQHTKHSTTQILMVCPVLWPLIVVFTVYLFLMNRISYMNASGVNLTLSLSRSRSSKDNHLNDSGSAISMQLSLQRVAFIYSRVHLWDIDKQHRTRSDAAKRLHG